MVVSQGGNYTKHVYMGSQRITSKVSNSGIFGTSPVNTTDLQAKLTAQTAKIKERFDSLGVKYSGVQQTNGLVSSSPNDSTKSYFYHSDHLGSSSLITNGSGDLVQHIQYVPFGEVFVEERNATWSTPYKFNGKELDEETGLCYYGARYYDPRTSVWISVDPMAEKFPDISSYVYCHDNPINMIDPTGKNDYRINQKTGQMDIKVTKAKSHSYYLVGENGKSHLVGTYSFNKKGLVQLKSTNFKNAQGSNVGFSVKDGNDSKMYLSADAVGSIIGAVADAGVNDLTVIGGSNADGSSPAPSVSHKNGKNVDLRYLRDDKSGDAVNLRSSDVDVQRQNQLNNSLYKFGWKDMISEYFNGGQLLNHTSSANDRNISTDHTTHLHMQGYRPDVVYLGPTLKEVIVTPRR